jgi:hypothetical protein
MIDINKQYRTRDGREVRIYAVDGQEDWPIHGATLKSFGWSSECWTKNGSSLTNMPHADDLVEVRPRHKRTVWVTVYPMNRYQISNENIQCDIYPPKRIACIKVELDFEEGEGL